MFLLSFFLSTLAIAAESPTIRLTCVTEYPSTSFVIESKGKELVARVLHHHGAKYAPAISGIFTPSDLPILARRAALVEKMSADMSFRWPLSSCKKHDDFRFECFGTEDMQLGEGGAKIAPFALYSTKIREDGIAGAYESLQLTMTFDVDGERDPSIEMKYPMEACVPMVRVLSK
jgi:hypothetical protein